MIMTKNNFHYYGMDDSSVKDFQEKVRRSGVIVNSDVINVHGKNGKYKLEVVPSSYESSSEVKHYSALDTEGLTSGFNVDSILVTEKKVFVCIGEKGLEERCLDFTIYI